jgi:response regulator of citrate/malate metabolism
MRFFNIRLDLSEGEFDILKKYIDFEKLEEKSHIEVVKTLLEKLKKPKEIDYSFKKHSASEKATKARSSKAKEKMQNAINILRMENKTITHYSIAQMSGVSFNTVKKYFNDDTIISLNEVK